MVSRGDDRGQVLLIAAITLAVVVLGVAVLLNAAVTTEVRAPDDPATDLDEADRVAGDIETGLAGVAARINAEGTYDDEDPLEDAFDANVSTFATYTALSMGHHRASMVNLSSANVTFGTYVADGDRTTDLRFAQGNVSNHSIRVSESDATEILGLTTSLNKTEINRQNGPNETVGFQFRGANDTCNLYSIETGSTRNDITVDVREGIDCEEDTDSLDNYTGTVAAECTLDNETEYARIEFRERPTSDDVCHVDPFADLDPVDGDGYGFSIRNPTSVSGGYGYLLGTRDFRGVDDGTVDDDVYWDSPDDHPYAVPVVWSFEVTLDQDARASSRVVTSTVPVYDDPDNVDGMGVPWR